MTPQVEVKLLGPLAVSADGRTVELGKGNERRLFVLLALNAGSFVPIERIIDTLWPETPPQSAREMVRIYVARLRRRLGENAISTREAGYVLATAPQAVDALRFEQGCAAGRRVLEIAPAEAADALDRALAEWRGRPFANVEESALVRNERDRLEELRLQALEDLFAARLSLGEHSSIVTDLDQLVRAHPYRERLRGELMLALYRGGRQADALERYRRGRELLVEELGVEPGLDLRALEKAILIHDPALLPERPPAPAPTPPSPAVPSRRQPRRSVVAILIGAAATLAILTLAVPRLLTRTSPHIGPASVGAIDARTGRVQSSLRIGAIPLAIGIGSGRLWIADTRRSLRELDRDRLSVVRAISLPAPASRLAIGFGSIWAGNAYSGTVSRIPKARGGADVFRPEPRSKGRVQLAAAFASLWTASQDGVLARLDPRSLRASAPIRGLEGPQALTGGFGSIWIGESLAEELVRVDPTSGRIQRRIPIGGIADVVAAGRTSVWALTPREGQVWRIDPRNNGVVAAIDIGRGATSMAVTRAGTWIGFADGKIVQINGPRNRVIRTIHVQGPVTALATDRDRVWVATGRY